MTNLQYKLKSLTSRVEAFESGEKYVKMRKESKQQLAAKDQEIKKLKLELANAHKETVSARNNWMQVFDDLQVEHAKTIRDKERINKTLEKRAIKAERRVDELKEENLTLRRECYAVKIELEKEQGKVQKMLAQINRNHENSSIPSSEKPNRKPITNNREKSGKSPGGQPGHKGHGRKKQIPDKTIQLPTPDEYAMNPDYEPTGRTIRRQRVMLKVLPYTEEYTAEEFINKKTGRLVYAEFPAGFENDVNYDGSVKAFVFLLNNYCNVSIDKTREFLSDLTSGALQISKGMIWGLSKEFSEKTKADQTEAFLNLVAAPVLNIDFTTSKVNGKNVNVAVCATPEEVGYYAREKKGHEGVKGTPAELNPNTLVHDHDRTFYKYGSMHQECLVHILRYLLDSTQNEKHLTWNKRMRELLREMIHYRKSLEPDEDLDPLKVEAFIERYGEILDKADEEYEYEPPNKYYMEGFNLKKRMREFQEAHLLFLHDKNVPFHNNLAERLLRVFKRKQRQIMTFRSFKSLEYLCHSLTKIANLRNNEENLYESISRIFD